jgi:hypothetical protein
MMETLHNFNKHELLITYYLVALCAIFNHQNYKTLRNRRENINALVLKNWNKLLLCKNPGLKKLIKIIYYFQ